MLRHHGIGKASGADRIAQRVGDKGHQPLVERAQILVRDGEARRLRVSAMPHQQLGAFVQRLGDVELLDGAARPARLGLALLDHHSWTVEHLAQPPRHQPNDHRLELRTSRENQRRLDVSGCQRRSTDSRSEPASTFSSCIWASCPARHIRCEQLVGNHGVVSRPAALMRGPSM